MSANDGRSVSLRTTLAACAAVLTLAIQATALGNETDRQAGGQTAAGPGFWDEPAYPLPSGVGLGKAMAVLNLTDSPFLIEPRFPHSDGSATDGASETLSEADFLAEQPNARPAPVSLKAQVASLGPTTAELVEEVNCLALNIYFEARNEPDEGQLAVAHVVLNRVSDPRFPETVCKVIRQGGARKRHRCQFSWWCDGLSDRPKNHRKWAANRAMAQAVYWGRSEDPTAGALWYHADYVSPYWGRVFKRDRQIGRHIFYLDQEKPTQVASRITDAPSTP
jgi:spore germination cell wall hydrolase CwlJ-like protein